MLPLQFCTRRDWLRNASAGFGFLALQGLLAEQSRADAGKLSALAVKPPHYSPRARRVIFLCMRGGPSHMETFDYKPQLNQDHGKPGRRGGSLKLLGSRWKFARQGESGLWMSELFPYLAQVADRLCVINSMHTDNENHSQALEQMHTGSFQFVRPSMGSWVLYGLGTENENLPGFISISPLKDLGGLRYYSSSFLPAAYSATLIGEAGKSIQDANIAHLTNDRLSRTAQRQQLDLLQKLNRNLAEQHPADHRLEGVIQSYELAFRMQNEVPRVMDLAGESKQTLDLYGIDGGRTDGFGRQCLLARRFAEAGVRFIEVTHKDWDHHGFLTRGMTGRCEEVDRPLYGLLTDLARRGMLDEALVVWGGEFGRTPDDPTEDGRGHNNKGFSMWLAGGGAKPGIAYGRTDEYGYEAIEDKVHIHDLHATILHLLGLNHERLTYRHGGRDYRLTDVHGRVVREVCA
ncbi:MAG TPA: DUF1501 domain-containing protein [Pirellulaceae bacterium]|nr:DUF1501 domain-containing protein [Pirellulaceae bacterium]